MIAESQAVNNGSAGSRGEAPFLSRVRLRAQRRALWLQALWSDAESGRGVAITETDVALILTDPAEIAGAEASFYEAHEQTRELTRRIELADRDAASHERWATLQRVFSLSRIEADLLGLAATVAIDPAFARVCAYLQDDTTATYVTVLFAKALFGWPPGERISTDSPLVAWRLARVPEHASYWVADPQIVHWLLDEPADKLTDPVADCLYPELLLTMRSFIDAVRNRGPVEIELIAPAGSGKRTLAMQLCHELRREMLVVESATMLPTGLSQGQVNDRVVQAARAARLEDAAIYWNNADVLDAPTRAAIGGLVDFSIFGGETAGSRSPAVNIARQTYNLPPIGNAQRWTLWKAFTGSPMPEEVAEWSLRPAEIRAATQVAGGGAEAVLGECRRMLHQNGELVSTLRCPYTWNDIILQPAVRKQLEEISAQARLRGEVLEHWGFERLCPMGRGISVLFAGPSGTGKTMAAQVLARELQRELCRVDLAEVINKYIGETEKRLKRVFDACERSAAVLFFDEADALFGQRTQVKEAHDRYANIQIDYLLQRMEQFDGIAILATNRKNDLDFAFLRRLRFIVDFHPPGPQERLQMWRRALADRSPAGEDLLAEIDWNWLADTLAVTGADINAAALAAAFLARAEGSKIRMDHVLHATRREMAKQNASWRAVGRAEDWSRKK